MAGRDSCPWSLAGGSACLFALTVASDRLPWQVAFAVSVPVVITWTWRGGPLAGAALGVIAWMCVTGFDVHRLGYIGINSSADVVRAAVLVLAGVLAASVPAAVAAVRSHRRADPVWAAFHEAGFTAESTSAGTTGRLYPIPHDAGGSSLESNRGNTTDA